MDQNQIKSSSGQGLFARLLLRIPPDWRWQIAMLPSADGFPPDRWTNLVRKAQPFADDTHPPREFRSLLTAQRLLKQSQTMRWELEARILGGESQESLAKRLGVDVSVILAYEAVWFDVRTRIACDIWLRHMVLRVPTEPTWPPSPLNLWWNVIAYRFGLDAFDQVFHASALGFGSNAGIDVCLSPFNRVDPDLRQWIAAQRMKVPKNSREMRLMQRAMNSSSRQGRTRKRNEAMLAEGAAITWSMLHPESPTRQPVSS
jgi:hypothetical protein